MGQTPGAVSYLGLAFLNNPGIATVGIQDGSNVLMPTQGHRGGRQMADRRTGPGHHQGQRRTRSQTAFLNYMISPEFQKDPIWDNLGFVPPSSPKIGSPRTGT